MAQRMPNEVTVVQNCLLDSTRWKRIPARTGDIVLSTWAKTGTTWVQQILSQLILGDRQPLPLSHVSPWVENRYVPLIPMLATLEAQQHPRFMKTHLPADALGERAGTRYIYVARDGRDTLWSWYNHHQRLNDNFYDIVRRHPDSIEPHLSPPVSDIREYFLEWLERDGYPLWPFWAHVRSWWELRAQDNVLLLHYDDLKRDIEGSIARIGRFVGKEIASSDVARVAARCSFAYMKTHATELLPENERVMIGGAEAFINRGEGGGWRGVLRQSDVDAYEERMFQELERECALWLSRPYEPRSELRG